MSDPSVAELFKAEVDAVRDAVIGFENAVGQDVTEQTLEETLSAALRLEEAADDLHGAAVSRLRLLEREDDEYEGPSRHHRA